MKNIASKLSVIIFTIVAVAAFAWMTMRPKAEAQVTGFGLSPSKSANTATVAPQKEPESEPESAENDTSSPLTNPDSAPESTDKDSSSDLKAEEENTETSEGEEEGAEKTEETSVDDKTSAPDTATTQENTDSSSENADNASQESEDTSQEEVKKQTDQQSQSNEEQAPAEPTPPTLDAPIAPTAPSSPAAPTSSDSTDDQAKKKTDIEKESVEQTSQTNSLATDATTKTEGNDTASESDNTDTDDADNKEDKSNGTTATVATATVVVAQNLQQKTDEENTSTLYTQAENARGTIVIMPSCDYKPDVEGGIVNALHKNLPQKGWNTLSFQLPNLSSTSTFKDLDSIMPEAAKNIESSLAMAKNKSESPIILLAHGCGSQIALAWMEIKGNSSIDAYIGLGTGIMNGDAKDTDHLRIPLEAMKFPQLDIFGSVDNDAVLKTAAERLGHINRAANPASRQKIILDADHNMTGKEDNLTRVIAKWLEKKAFKQ
ncbi:MAG: DUF3530 family protein [Cocleimonas sp.]|nr:DUF3530 family protein [Cocleimonas sp.]